MTNVDLATELQKIYDSEINVRITWLWDGGIDVQLGDQVSGFLAQENVGSVKVSLDPEIRSHAVTRLFRPPKVGATAICPHCGAPNASMMDEPIAYVCRHCGEAVKAKPPRVQ